MNTNDATRATAEGLPEINRRRFLLNTTMAGAAAVVAAPVAAAEPETSPLEQAIWHLHELKRLAHESGMEKVAIIVVGTPHGSTSWMDNRVIKLNFDGTISADDGVFAPKGGAS